MIERTEELGLAARLPIVVGGQLVELRTLNLEESEVWLDKLAHQAAGVAQAADVDEPDPGALLATLAKLPTAGMLELVQAYDVDGRLPGLKQLRQRFTQAEVYAAVKAMTQAEAPFLTDVRSLVEAFGPQLRALATTVLFNLYRQESSTNGPSPIGASTPEPSDHDSPRNGSSSSGDTATAESSAKPRKPRSPLRSLPPTAISTQP